VRTTTRLHFDNIFTNAAATSGVSGGTAAAAAAAMSRENLIARALLMHRVAIAPLRSGLRGLLLLPPLRRFSAFMGSELHAEADFRWLERRRVEGVVDKWLRSYDDHGFFVVLQMLEGDDLRRVKSACDDLLSGRVNASRHRHDLGSNEGQERRAVVPAASAPASSYSLSLSLVVWCVQKLRDVENVTQVMWPSQYFSWMVTGGCLLAHLAGLGSSHDVCRWRATVLLQARCTAVRCSSHRW
jgi:hypothetical protein